MKHKILEFFILFGYIIFALFIIIFLIVCINNFKNTFFCIISSLLLILSLFGCYDVIKEHIEDNIIIYCKHCKKYVWVYKDNNKNIICPKCSTIIKKYNGDYYNDIGYDEDEMP